MRKTAFILGFVNFVSFISLGWLCVTSTAPQPNVTSQVSRVGVPLLSPKSTVSMTVPLGMKPVYLTKSKVIRYSVCVPVRETHEKVIHYTVKVPVYETHEKVIPYTVTSYVQEPQVRVGNGSEPASQYFVFRPITEQKSKTISYTTCKMIAEQRSKVVRYTTCKMVSEQRQKTVDYQTVEFEPIIGS